MKTLVRDYRSPRKATGPIALCSQCGRRHPRRKTCKLFLRTREAKSGRKVKRWAP